MSGDDRVIEIEIPDDLDFRVQVQRIEIPDQGPLLDDEVHRLVFGDPEAAPAHIAPELRDSVQLPRYSFLIGPATELVYELAELGWLTRVQVQPEGFARFLDSVAAVPYRGWIDRRVVAWIGIPGQLHETEGVGHGHAVPLAICRAIHDAAHKPGFKGFRHAQS